ncbi:MAG TPA: amidohydrolase family protein [Drouetiella sp.]
MRTHVSNFFAVLFVAFLVALPLAASAKESATTSVYLHANVVDVEHGLLRKNKTIVVDKGVIVSVADDYSVGENNGARVYDLKNAFVIPALCDMHTHGTTIPGWANLFVANGVMTVRDMGSSSMRPILMLREQIASGQIIGPHIYGCGKILDGSPVASAAVDQLVTNAAEGRQAVDTHLENHADFIKVYNNLLPDTYFGIVAECKRTNTVFAGHVPRRITLVQASDAGQHSVEHLLGLYVPCVERGYEVYKDNRAQNKAFCLQHADEVVDEKAMKVISEKLIANDTYLCPTLVTLRAMSFGDRMVDEKLPSYANYVPDMIRAKWDWRKDKRTSSLSSAEWATRKKIWDGYKPVLHALVNNGVQFLTGTDVTNPFVYPGISVHNELAWLVDFGFTPAQALAASTINPASYLRIDRTYGSVAVNKIADLVILSKNPLEDIHNTQSIEALVYRGKYFDKSDIERLKISGLQNRSSEEIFDTVHEPD